MLKRLFDLVISAISFTIILPFFIAIIIAIKLTSKGPIFYLGERIGLNGEKFNILKFRTMMPDAEVYGTTTSVNDPRITKTGFFLRKYKLDELPQLINVIKGDMSLVGPRPEVEEHTREYNEEEKQILSVKPGITDYSSITFYNLAEVLGPDNPHQVYLSHIRAKKNQLRLQYVRKQSFLEDINILVKTSILLISIVLGKLKKK